MNRLIDAYSLQESFRKQAVNVQGKIKDDADAIIEAICKDIDLAPTIDAVQVVRCGECKYWDRSDPFFFNGVVRCECKLHENEYWTADGFCSDADRDDSEIPNS